MFLRYNFNILHLNKIFAILVDVTHIRESYIKKELHILISYSKQTLVTTNNKMGKNLILIGCIIVFIGLTYHLFPSALKWFGNLPGDIKVEKPNTKIYFPIVSMLLVSVIVNVLWRLFKYLQ